MEQEILDKELEEDEQLKETSKKFWNENKRMKFSFDSEENVRNKRYGKP